MNKQTTSYHCKQANKQTKKMHAWAQRQYITGNKNTSLSPPFLHLLLLLATAKKVSHSGSAVSKDIKFGVRVDNNNWFSNFA